MQERKVSEEERDGTERVMNPDHGGVCFRENEINKHENNGPQHLASRTKTNKTRKANYC